MASNKYGRTPEEIELMKERAKKMASKNVTTDPELEKLMQRFKGVTKDSDILKSNEEISEAMSKAAKEYVDDFDDSASYAVKRFKESDIPSYSLDKLKNPGMNLQSIPDEATKEVNRLDLLNDIKAKFDKGPSALEEMSEEKVLKKLEQPKKMQKVLKQMEMDELGRASREALPEKQAISKAVGPKLASRLSKAGKIGGGLALGLAGELLLPEELGDPSSIIEDPDASPEERKAAMEAMMAESRPEMESQMRKQALDDMMEKLRQEKLQRAEMLMKKYGKR